MNMVKTRSGDVGTVVAEAIREVMAKATAGMTVATYIETLSPVGWDSLGDAGWDLAGVVDDADSATLRDLVEIAGAWGSTLIQLPLMPTILAKRHSAAAAEIDGAVTFSVPIQSLAEGSGFVPFGQLSGISIVDSFEGAGTVRLLGGGTATDFAPSLLGTVVPMNTVLSGEISRELAVVWAAEAAGIARRVLTDAVEFAKQRHQFGKPIGSFQAIKHHLANAHIAAEFAETAAIWASLQPDDSERAVTQSFAETMRSVQLSIQVYGGLGFTWEMGLHFYLRHITTLRELAKGVGGNA